MDYSAALNPVGMLKPDWLGSKEVVLFIKALRSADIDLAFSGGAVRDAILNPHTHPKDYDVFANADAARLKKVLQSHGFHVRDVPMERRVSATLGKAFFDLFHLPVKGDDTSQWLSPENLREKVLNFEFTLNTPVLTPEGELYDFFNAIPDIRAGHVRFLVDPMQSLKRIATSRAVLRYFRFCSQFDAPLNAYDVDACKAHTYSFDDARGKLKQYIRRDICALLIKSCAVGAFARLQECDLLETACGLTSASLTPMRALNAIEKTPESQESMQRRILALVMGYGKGPLEGLTAFAERLELDAATRKKLTALIHLLPQVNTPDDERRRILVENLPKETLETLLLLRSAAEGDETRAKELYLSLAQRFSREGYIAPQMAAQYVAVRGGNAPYQMTDLYGFTLIELSITLVIIGLLVGGIVVGRDLIHAGEIRTAVSQLERYNEATNTFKAKYNCLPGDCTLNVAQAMQLTTTSIGTANCPPGYPGDGNGIVGWISVYENWKCGGSEELMFWQHLQDAHLISDPTTLLSLGVGSGNGAIPQIKFSAVSPTTREQGGISIIPGDVLIGSPVIRPGQDYSGVHLFWFTAVTSAVGGGSGAAVLTPQDAYAIDQKVDDGYPLTGSAFAAGDNIGPRPNLPSEGNTAAQDCVTTDTTPYSYNVKATKTATDACSLFVKTSF